MGLTSSLESASSSKNKSYAIARAARNLEVQWSECLHWNFAHWFLTILCYYIYIFHHSTLFIKLLPSGVRNLADLIKSSYFVILQLFVELFNRASSLDFYLNIYLTACHTDLLGTWRQLKNWTIHPAGKVGLGPWFWTHYRVPSANTAGP